MRHSQRAIFFFAIVFAMMFEFSENTLAGQFKRITATSTIGAGRQIEIHASPQNCCSLLDPANLGTMETDVYEFETNQLATLDFRCSILSNTTGQALNLRMIQVNGRNIETCTAPVNGTCAVTRTLLEDSLIQCTVSTGPDRPVMLGTQYILAIGRP